MLVNHGTKSEADHVYSSIIGTNESQLSSVMLVALLVEGFSLQVLSDNFKETAGKRIIADYCGFVGSFHGRLLGVGSSFLSRAPVFALSASPPSMWVSYTNFMEKFLC